MLLHMGTIRLLLFNRNIYKVAHFFPLGMKVKLSISLDEETLEKVEQRLQDGTFRNRSHVIEWATRKGLEE